MERAGLPVHIVNKLNRTALLRIAAGQTHEARIEQLHQGIEKKPGAKASRGASASVSFAPGKPTKIWIPAMGAIPPSEAGSLARVLREVADALDARAAEGSDATELTAADPLDGPAAAS